MEIRIIAPVIDGGVTDVTEAEAVVAPGVKVTRTDIATGPPSVESRFDEALAVPGLLAAAATAEREGADAVVIDCMGDPGLEAARELLRIPVVGAAQASMLIAAGLGHRFAVVTVLDRLRPVFDDTARRYGLDDRYAGVRSVEVPVLEIEQAGDRIGPLLATQAVAAIEDDGAHVVVFGCTGFAGQGRALADALAARGHPGIPVVDPLPAAVKSAETLVTLGLRQSERTYPSPPRKPVRGYDPLTGGHDPLTGGHDPLTG